MWESHLCSFRKWLRIAQQHSTRFDTDRFLSLQATSLLLRDALALFRMHAESHLEVVENKGEGRTEGSVNFVKCSEIDNTVNSAIG